MVYLNLEQAGRVKLHNDDNIPVPLTPENGFQMPDEKKILVMWKQLKWTFFFIIDNEDQPHIFLRELNDMVKDSTLSKD